MYPRSSPTLHKVALHVLLLVNCFAWLTPHSCVYGSKKGYKI